RLPPADPRRSVPLDVMPDRLEGDELPLPDELALDPAAGELLGPQIQLPDRDDVFVGNRDKQEARPGTPGEPALDDQKVVEATSYVDAVAYGDSRRFRCARGVDFPGAHIDPVQRLAPGGSLVLAGKKVQRRELSADDGLVTREVAFEVGARARDQRELARATREASTAPELLGLLLADAPQSLGRG